MALAEGTDTIKHVPSRRQRVWELRDFLFQFYAKLKYWKLLFDKTKVKLEYKK